ncbi:radical SAM family heme chaperone HemW [Asticcacaulis excentricus]|uniref:Heme chaperone HemW n=1 Tax=Asticcacaulis excentricus (strain ATCC 15261 / DSM 4724 / KCTC 12464 / NCIMB 9791 / VKM B-1370 / CB 48) TaxID=573065 RepID=E8RMY7_ASTEC|nr:radical SAM family heme chaperone HemW [Asticcacaulis excentricus]ADU11750.1 oxygen-independent coproporphyrinogen III oxidase [Asticcacaulis excentricus CB 48]
MAVLTSAPVALYIHWPYCSRICPYCDFNVTRDRGQADTQNALFEAIRADLRMQASWLGPRRLVSVFFGGGTPSLMKPDWVAAVINEAKTLFPVTNDIEITLEANPTDAEIARYRAFQAAGINRLSIGIQSLNDAALRFLGRNHSAREALMGLETALSVFDRVSLDLIYALPDQSLENWEDELRRAAHLGVEHISPYQLTIESETAFGRAARRGQLRIPDPERGEAFYDQTQSVLTELGYEAYEVSNHARGKEARSKHNINVWEGVDYVGIGPGAHGRLTFDKARHATVAEPDLKAYIARVRETGHSVTREPLSPEEASEEALMLGLRLIEGVRLERIAGLPLNKSDELIAGGFLEATRERLRATPKGRVVLDRLLLELLS